MPYIDFVSKDDRASLWYSTNTRNGGVSDFDPDKPVILMYEFCFCFPSLLMTLNSALPTSRLHPLFLDSSWLVPQFEDPRLTLRYNLVAFDLRCSGRSNARPSGAHDTWVDAADLAFALLVRARRVALHITSRALIGSCLFFANFSLWVFHRFIFWPLRISR